MFILPIVNPPAIDDYRAVWDDELEHWVIPQCELKVGEPITDAPTDKQLKKYLGESTWVGGKGQRGRKRKYNNEAELKKDIDEYFSKIRALITDDNGNVIGTRWIGKATMSGLAIAIGMDRTTLVGYSNKDEYFNTVRDARNIVESQLENTLSTQGNNTGPQFVAKNNFGWHDKTEVSVEASVIDAVDSTKMAELAMAEMKRIEGAVVDDK